MVADDKKISWKLKNKSQLSIEKNIKLGKIKTRHKKRSKNKALE